MWLTIRNLNEAIKNVDQAIALNPELALGHFVKEKSLFFISKLEVYV